MVAHRSRLSTILIDVPAGAAPAAAAFWSQALGVPATPVPGRWLECRTLRTPGGHLVCVTPRHSDPEVFQRLSHVWQ